MTSVDNLTAMEISALTDAEGTLNLTDGHARLPLTQPQAEIVAGIPAMFHEALRRTFQDIETEAHATLFATLGQHQAPVGSGRILSCYSSTLATDIVARALPHGCDVAILHPTFDNIADLFRTRGLVLHPLYEEELQAGLWPTAPVQAIVVTHPNNPTGLVMTAAQLDSLARHCVDHGQTLIIDASFRGQDRRAQYDCYALLEDTGVDWIVIEDTGKLFPTHELKAGFVAFNERCRHPIRDAFHESLLSVSPVILLLVTALARDWRSGGYERARDLVNSNRALVREELSTVGLELADPDSKISVARVALRADGPTSEQLYHQLVDLGVHVLPCPPFHWAHPDEGLRFIRLSLARPRAAVVQAAQALATVYSPYVEPVATAAHA